ncbi:hypothetical protein ACHAW5_006406 [Stephanodiscus triporus]|uniref:BZIP domain-containing protein n=1 Tax=Stephanodiscus triporus TaxID=2934178 RepID=A0ABD3NZI8_9STRA
MENERRIVHDGDAMRVQDDGLGTTTTGPIIGEGTKDDYDHHRRSSPNDNDNYNDDVDDAGDDDDRDAATKKRLAKYGQWRTPPLPAFAASVTSSANASSLSSSTTAAITAATTSFALPSSADEYARMLRDAYERGAVEGARVAASSAGGGGGEGRTIVVGSTTNTGTTTTKTGVEAVVGGGGGMGGTMPPPPPPPPPVAVRGPNDPPPRRPSPMSTTTAASGVNYGNPSPAAVRSGEFVANNNNNNVVGGPSSSFVPPPPPPSSSSFSHSRSMPDMSSYRSTMTHVNDEEDKRKKRLARNRASARLRRLKKKNLVDSYEGEVGILETALSRLKSHKWGSDVIDHEVLIEALSMERGQQPLTPEGRRELIQSILNQQREQVANLLECQIENWLLCSLANNEDIIATDDPDGGGEEMARITSELRSLLNLDIDQLANIERCSRDVAHEVRDLFTVDECLKSIHSNGWLLDEGVDGVASQFTDILNQTQLSKFLLWCDHNAESIERLDCVNALGGCGGEGGDGGPPFEFGVDEGLADGD